MHTPVPLFAVREYGTVREAGHVCPACKSGRLQAHLDPDGSEALVCPTCNHRTDAGWRRHHFDTQRPAFLAGSLDVRTGPLFASVQHYLVRPDPDDESPYHLADLMFDIDFEGDLERATDTAQALTTYLDSIGAFHRTYFSGSKGFHIEVPWQVVGAQPSRHLHERVYKRLVQGIAAELDLEFCMHIYSRARMFRVAGTLHPKTGLYKTWIGNSYLEPAYRAQILEVASTPMDPPDVPYTSSNSLQLNDQPVRSPELHRRYLEALAYTESLPEESSVKLTATFEAAEHPACIRRALEEGPPGPGTRHALNVNTAAYWAGVDGDSDEFVSWARNVPGGSDTPATERAREAGQAIRWAKAKRPPFRCEVMQDLDLCDPNCPFYTKLP